MVHNLFFIICVIIVINKQESKQTINFILLKSETWKKKLKKFMNAFDITKKYYKLACMDGIKT
jgi:hypothetical protein